jgi:CheY-like chemotaxis protein
MANARILIVEDEPIIAWDLQRRLTRLGYVVLGSVSSGQDALEKALALKPDLILMDIRLAGTMDGIEAASASGRSSRRSSFI